MLHGRKRCVGRATGQPARLSGLARRGLGNTHTSRPNPLLQQCATKAKAQTHWGGAALCGTAGGTAARPVPLRRSCSCHPPGPWVADSQHTCSQQGQQGNISMPCPIHIYMLLQRRLLALTKTPSCSWAGAEREPGRFSRLGQDAVCDKMFSSL